MTAGAPRVQRVCFQLQVSRWQAEMSPFFEELSGVPDDGFLQLTEVFHLEDQLALASEASLGT